MSAIGIALSPATTLEFDQAMVKLATQKQAGALVLDVRRANEQGQPTAVIEVGTSPVELRGTTELFTDRAKAVAREAALRQAGKTVRRVLATAQKVMDMRADPPVPLVTGQEVFHLIHYDD